MKNQCDGCQAGIPVVNGNHRMGREGGYPDLMGCTAKLYTDAPSEPAIHPLQQTLRENGDLIAAQATIAQQAQMIEHLRGGPTPLFTAVDMGTASADGRRSLAEYLIKQIAIEHPDQDTLLTVKYIAQWIALETGL